MNGKLYDIPSEPEDLAFSSDERNLLFDYFNLCGEEYLYYAHGYIYPEVWNAWYRGMLIFRKNPRIKKLWDEELATESYYGLAFDDQKAEKETTQLSTRREEDDQAANSDLRDVA